jgi:Holliday junction resolvase
MEKLKLTETDIRHQIQDYLRWQGWFVFYHLQGLGCYKGIPDLEAVKNGKTVYIEVKKPSGRQSKHQKKFQSEVERHGGNYEIARSLEDAMRIDQFYGT